MTEVLLRVDDLEPDCVRLMVSFAGRTQWIVLGPGDLMTLKIPTEGRADE